MLIKTASRIKTAVKDMLAALDDGVVSTVELRDALGEMKAVPALVTAFQVAAAEIIAEHEGHADKGAGVLAVGAGLSRRDAHSQVKTAETLKGMPKVRDAVRDGRIPVANARHLVGAAVKTSKQDVEADDVLLGKAVCLQPEQFSREARRWTVEQQNDRGETDYKRQRSKRYVKVWDGADGMVHLHGQFDTVTGHRIGNRLRHTARQLYKTDKKNTNHSNSGSSNSGSSNSDRRSVSRHNNSVSVYNGNSSPHSSDTGVGCNGGVSNGDRRTFDQCMADALDNLTSSTTNPVGITGSNTDQLFGGAATTNPAGSSADQLFGSAAATNPADIAGSSTGHLFGGAAATNPNGAAGSVGVGCVTGRPFADIAVVAHVDDRTGELVAEIAGGDPLPPSVLDELACNASIVGMLYNTKGIPLWQGYTKRTATAGQLKALIARYGGCFACGAHPAMCQAHHIKPWSKGGPTNIDNMVLVCWQCHQNIHHHNWQITTHNKQHTLHPPDPASRDNRASREPTHPSDNRTPVITHPPNRQLHDRTSRKPTPHHHVRTPRPPHPNRNKLHLV